MLLEPLSSIKNNRKTTKSYVARFSSLHLRETTLLNLHGPMGPLSQRNRMDAKSSLSS